MQNNNADIVINRPHIAKDRNK